MTEAEIDMCDFHTILKNYDFSDLELNRIKKAIGNFMTLELNTYDKTVYSLTERPLPHTTPFTDFGLLKIEYILLNMKLHKWTVKQVMEHQYTPDKLRYLPALRNMVEDIKVRPESDPLFSSKAYASGLPTPTTLSHPNPSTNVAIFKPQNVNLSEFHSLFPSSPSASGLLSSGLLSSRLLSSGLLSSGLSSSATPSIVRPKKVAGKHAVIKPENVNLSKFYKEVHLTCDSIDHFTTFYKSLHYHGKKYNILTNPYDEIAPNNLSCPKKFDTTMRNYMQNTMKSILSRDGIFQPSFTEGRKALQLTTKGYDVLDMLLRTTHSKLKEPEKEQCQYSFPTKLKNCELKEKSSRASKSRKKSKISISGIDDSFITINDVLFGRGKGTYSHEGNTLFRKLVQTYKDKYQSSKKREKKLIAQFVVDSIKTKDPPGRFLELNSRSGSWDLVDYERAIEKACQALRDKRCNQNLNEVSWALSESTSIQNADNAKPDCPRSTTIVSDEVRSSNTIVRKD